MVETCAVILALAYLLLATRENILCWHCAFISSAIYVALNWQAKLPMVSALSVYYMGMAVYGWYQWRHGGRQQAGVRIHTLSARRHLLIFGLILTLSAVSGYLLDRYTQTVWPYVDSFVTWGSVITTYLVTKKILENWLYWILIDSIGISLYIKGGLHQTALLLLIYVVICVYGYFSWRELRRQQVTDG